MILNVPLLLLALVLLLFPRTWLRFGTAFFRRRVRSSSNLDPGSIREPGDPSVHFATEFGKFRNYVDLVRAAAGSVCLMGEFKIDSCLLPAEHAPSSVVLGTVAIKSAILLLGLLLQAVRVEKRRVTFYPPIFYLAGLSVALCNPYGALFAFILIWAFNPMLPSAQGFLTVYAVLMMIFGMYFSGLGDKSTILAGVLCFLPVLLSLLAQRPLVIFARRVHHSENVSP